MLIFIIHSQNVDDQRVKIDQMDPKSLYIGVVKNALLATYLDITWINSSVSQYSRRCIRRLVVSFRHRRFDIRGLLCSMGYLYEKQLKIKSLLSITYIAIAQSFWNVAQSSITAVLCAKFQNDWATDTNVVKRREIARVVFRTDISYCIPPVLSDWKHRTPILFRRIMVRTHDQTITKRSLGITPSFVAFGIKMKCSFPQKESMKV